MIKKHTPKRFVYIQSGYLKSAFVRRNSFFFLSLDDSLCGCIVVYQCVFYV
jgi:hypothetical protein